MASGLAQSAGSSAGTFGRWLVMRNGKCGSDTPIPRELRLYVHVLRKAASGVADGFAGAIEQAAVSKPVSKSGGVSKIC
jgi:hypothetical protein